MNRTNLEQYRNNLENEKGVREGKTQQMILYVAGGALALFLTVNEKLFDLTESIYKWAMISSLACLILCLALMLVTYLLDTKYHAELLDEADVLLTDKEKTDFDTAALVDKWKPKNNNINIITYITIGLLVVGILFEAFFLSSNLFKSSEKKKSKSETIIITNKKDTVLISGDTNIIIQIH